jgi:hypothetical protein
MHNPEQIIKKLALSPHPEGGYFRETYRNSNKINQNTLKSHFFSNRNLATAIYFFLEFPDFSAWHRLKADEMWHFYLGEPLTLYILSKSNEITKITLGQDIIAGQHLQYLIPGGDWFAAQPQKGWSLTGCTTAPGFDFADFELGEASKLLKTFPQHAQIIKKYCRQS